MDPTSQRPERYTWQTLPYLPKFSLQPLTTDDSTTVLYSEDIAGVLLSQFSRNSNLNRQCSVVI